MRPLLLAALLLLLAASPVQADGSLDVSVDRPSYLYFRPVEGDAKWQQFGDSVWNGGVTIPVTDTGVLYEVKAEAPGLWTTWSATESDLIPGNTSRSMQLEQTVNWGRIASVLGLLVGAAAMFMHLRVRHAHEEKERILARQVEEAESSQSLFSADGKLPTRIGPYRVRSRLGQGGMAVVFKVEDEEGRPLALKIPLPHLLQDHEFMARFNREMRVGATLNHARIVRIHEWNPGEGRASRFRIWRWSTCRVAPWSPPGDVRPGSRPPWTSPRSSSTGSSTSTPRASSTAT